LGHSVGTGSVRSLRPNSYPSGYSTSYSPPPAHLYSTHAGSGLGSSISPALLGSGTSITGGSGSNNGSSNSGTSGSGIGSVRSSFVATLSSALSGDAQSKNSTAEHTKDDTSKKRE